MSSPLFGNYRVSQTFGQKNAALTGGTHNGIDYACPVLTPIHAIIAGTIIGVSQSKTAGLFITQRSGAFIIRYLHLAKSNVSVGAQVTAGQVIALSGNSGLSTGPHLHVDAQKDGVFINPAQIINNNPVTPSANSSVNTPGGSYVIRSGDTLYALEAAWGIPHGTLQQLNPTIVPTKMAIGTVITTPFGVASVPSPSQQFYNIKSGDTFWALENKFQLKHGTLQALNPNINPRNLQINQRIRIK